MSGNGKLPRFAWIALTAADVLLENFEGEERRTALAIYTALALISSMQHRGDHVSIEAARPTIAKKAGVDPKTLDRYMRLMEPLGLVVVERRRVGLRNLENLYSLPSDPSGVTSLPQPDPPGAAESDTPRVAASDPEGGDTSAPRLKEEEEGRQQQHQEQEAHCRLLLPPPTSTTTSKCLSLPEAPAQGEGDRQRGDDVVGLLTQGDGAEVPEVEQRRKRAPVSSGVQQPDADLAPEPWTAKASSGAFERAAAALAAARSAT